ncbi:Uncharacterised protein [Legionella israelensis]|nr:Uncharacterised protein [Legionella israelensis]
MTHDTGISDDVHRGFSYTMQKPLCVKLKLTHASKFVI